MDGRCLQTGQPLELPKSLQHWYGNNPAPVTLPDGHSYKPGSYSYMKWNPDAFADQIVQFPNSRYQTDEYWYGTTPTYMGQLRMPIFSNVNLNVTRDFAIRGRYKFQLLGAFTNLFNRQNFSPGAVSNGVSTITTPTSGATIGEDDGGLGSLGDSMMDPREVTLTLRFQF
jgi:hypothetical protein